MKTSRQSLLDYLRTQQAVTAAEISRAMQMTEANARHHLNLLIQQGLVAVVGKRSSQGKGRPVLVYGLSEQAAGNNLALLASALLELWSSELTPQDYDQRLSQLANRLLAALSGDSSPPSGPHLTQRLYQAIRLLNQAHYAARWEAHALAPHVIFGRCPYLQVASTHPEICQLDRRLIEQLTGAPAEQVARLQPDRRGLPQCIFVLNKNAEKPRPTPAPRSP
ncbi:MAG: helix-turn-helix domain-containing protein [Anaerolineales bacterium]|nr:helix-turn-helix domain-containing protein [Anaerolineales bacterium]